MSLFGGFQRGPFQLNYQQANAVPLVVGLEYSVAVQLLASIGITTDVPTFVQVHQSSPYGVNRNVLGQSIPAGSAIIVGERMHLMVEKRGAYPAIDTQQNIPYWYFLQ